MLSNHFQSMKNPMFNGKILDSWSLFVCIQIDINLSNIIQNKIESITWQSLRWSQVILAQSEPAGFCCFPAYSLQPESGNESGGRFCSVFGTFRPNPVGNLLEISVKIPTGIRLQGICWNTKEPTGTQRNLQERLPENEWNHRFRHPEHSTWDC
jgi:hypothetical protein